MTLLSEGTFDAACSAVHAAAHAADLVADGVGAAYAAVRPPGHHAGPAFFGGACYLNNAAAAAQRLRAAGYRARCRSSTSTPIRATARRRSSGTGPTCSTPACTSTPAPAGSPTSSATPTSAAGATARAGTSTCRCRQAPATSRGWPVCDSLLAAVDRHRSDAVVVSLGVDAAAVDPAAPLEVTAAGFRAAGASIAELGSADGVRAGRRIRARSARRPGGRGARRVSRR